MLPRILLTPGEPAGIGPDIVLQIAKRDWPVELIAIADPDLLGARAALLGERVILTECQLAETAQASKMGVIKYLPIKLSSPVLPGKLTPKNAHYVIETLQLASALCLKGKAQALVTGPVQKSVLNDAGIPFFGHTEFLANVSQVPLTVMLFVVTRNNQKPLRVALATTHLPLKEVPSTITSHLLEQVASILQTGLQTYFDIQLPRILVAGLNPHAGENGYLGREEIDVIKPTIEKLQQKYDIHGPIPADTIFLPEQSAQSDAILALYHDQALPLIKYLGFNQAVNMTLGLPFVRTSVDHGTALPLAGTGRADAGSFFAAIDLAIQLCNPIQI